MRFCPARKYLEPYKQNSVYFHFHISKCCVSVQKMNQTDWLSIQEM